MSMEKEVARQVRDLFYMYGVTFKFGAAHILSENKERARVYTELLSKFKSEHVAEAITMRVSNRRERCRLRTPS